MGRKVIMNNVMHLVKNNILKLVMAILIALSFALSGVGHAQTSTTTTTKKIVVGTPDSGSGSYDMQKSGSGWGG